MNRRVGQKAQASDIVNAVGFMEIPSYLIESLMKMKRERYVGNSNLR